jgi:hypothetical protein
VECDAGGVVTGGATPPEGGIDHQGEEIGGAIVIEDIAGQDAACEEVGEIGGVVDEIADEDLGAGVPDEIGSERGGVEEPGESRDGEGQEGDGICNAETQRRREKRGGIR